MKQKQTIMNSKKDKIATISAICCIASAGFILGITIVTMILQAAAGGTVLYPIISLIMGSVCYYIVTKDRVRAQIENEKMIEDMIKKEREKILYN